MKVVHWWRKRLGGLQWPAWCRWRRRRQPVDELSRLIQETRVAWHDYEAAHVYFNYVKDPELIDHSIYRLEAASKRFTYLWNQLKELRKAENSPPGPGDCESVPVGK